MANRKARRKPIPLKYHHEPSPADFWRWILKGDPLGIIRPKPKCFPPFVPMAPYRKELLRLVSRMAREQELHRDGARLEAVQKQLRKTPLASERELATWNNLSRDKVHRLLEVKRTHDRLVAYLDRTLTQRRKAAGLRPLPKKRTAVRNRT
jgi:hypothetical protein